MRVATNSREPLITRVVIDLARKIPYTVENVGEELRVLFTRAADAATRRASTGPAAAAAGRRSPRPGRGTAGVAPAAPRHRRRGGRRPPAPQRWRRRSAARCPAPPAAARQPAARSRRTARAQFTGDPISLDFQGADLRAVLRTFAEISGLNIVIDPTIQGTVDVSLHDVPWDQALDIILRANKLGYSVDGTIVRIAPLTVLADEEEERRKLPRRRRSPASCAC